VVNSPAPEPNIFVSMNITGAPSNCRLVDDYYFILASGTDGYPQMYKLLLRAYAQGETVTIRTTFSPVVGFNDPCTVDYVVLDQ